MFPSWPAGPMCLSQRGNAQGTTGGLPGGGATGRGEHRNWETVVGLPRAPNAQPDDDAKSPTATSNFTPERERGQGGASSAPFVKDAVSGL